MNGWFIVVLALLIGAGTGMVMLAIVTCSFLLYRLWRQKRK